MASDSAMFDGRRQYHPTSILSPVPYPLSEPPATPASSSAASLTASFLRSTPPHPSSAYEQAEQADEMLAYHHSHAVPLSAVPSASLTSAGLRTVSSSTSLSSLGSSSSSLSHMPATRTPTSHRPTDVDYELFDIFQMASSFEGVGDAGQLFQHSLPASSDPLGNMQPLFSTSTSQLSPPRPSQPPSGLASQHLQDAMLRQLAGNDRAAFLSLSPLPSPAASLTPPPVVPLQPPMLMHDEAAAVKGEVLSPTRDSEHGRPLGLSPLSPHMDSSRTSASSTPSSSASFHPGGGVPSRASPVSTASAPMSPYAQLPPALLHQLLAQQQHTGVSYPSTSAVSPSLAAAAAATQVFMPYPLSAPPATGIPLAPHSHSTMQEDDDEDDDDDDDTDETELPRAHKRTHLASPSSHVSTLPHRPSTTAHTATTAGPTSEEKEREMKAEQQQSADPHTDTDEHKDTADPANPSSSSSPLSSGPTHHSRLSRKAELARASRKRKKMYVADLEEKVSKLASTVEELQKKLKKNAGGLSKEERVRREQQSAIKERLTQLIAQTQMTGPAAAAAAPDAAATTDAGTAVEQASTAASSSPPAVAITPPVRKPETSYELQELVTRFVYNCFTDDEQVLTELGFLSVDHIVTHLQHCHSLNIACYNADSAMTEYHPIELQHVTRPPVSWQRIVRFQSVEADIDLRVTDNHDMWLRANDSEPFCKLQAGQLLTEEDDCHRTQLLTCAERGVWHGREYEWTEPPFVRLLGVNARSEHDALLELYGYWLGGGGLCEEHEECIVLLAASDSQSHYVDKLLAAVHAVLPSVAQKQGGSGNSSRRYRVYCPQWLELFAHPNQPFSRHRTDRFVVSSLSPLFSAASSPSFTPQHDATAASQLVQHSEHVQMPRWLLNTLGREQLRAVIGGVSYSSAPMEATGKQAMYASSSAFRDQLQLLALHAGYSSHFTLHAPSARWCVSYSDSAALTQPTLHTTRDVTAAIDSCHVWCVTVPQQHQLIWARRVLTTTHSGDVLSASRPVVTGNSRERQGHVDYYFDRVAHCLPSHDTRVLTNHGFLFLSEIEERVAAGQSVLYACYEPSTSRIVYTPGRVVLSASPERWVDFTQAATRRLWDGSDDYGSTAAAGAERANRLTLRTTPKHDMFVQLCMRRGKSHTAYEAREASGAPIPPHKMKAEELAPGYQCDCSAAGGTCTHGHSTYRMYTGAASGLQAPADGISHKNRSDPHSPVVALGLCSEDELNAFLELFGYWLGDGSMQYHTRSGGSSAVVFTPCEPRDRLYVPRVLARLHLVLDRDFTSSETSTRLVVQVIEPRWFRFFDEEFGIKYCNSTRYNAAEALVKQDMHSTQRRPSTSAASTVSASASVDLSSTSSRRSSVSSVCLDAGADDSVPESLCCLQCGSVEDLSMDQRTMCVVCSNRCIESSAGEWGRQEEDWVELESPAEDAEGEERRDIVQFVDTGCWNYSVHTSHDATTCVASVESLPASMPPLEDSIQVEEPLIHQEPPVKKEQDRPLKSEIGDEDESMDDGEADVPDDVIDLAEDDDEKQPSPSHLHRLPPPSPVDDEHEPAKSVKWLPDWVLFRLDKEQLRLVIEGVRQADCHSAATRAQVEAAAAGDGGGEALQATRCISTSGVGFRDQLIHACLHAGYSAYFKLNTRAGGVRGYHALPDYHTIYSKEEMEEALKADSTRRFREVRARHDNWYHAQHTRSLLRPAAAHPSFLPSADTLSLCTSLPPGGSVTPRRSARCWRLRTCASRATTAFCGRRKRTRRAGWPCTPSPGRSGGRRR